jgi:hypothetical protein
VQLVRLKLEKFRRFAEAQSLDLNEDLIALVGPNEAGKSSILAALGLLGRGQCPAGSDRTRGLQGAAVISALFVLDEDDREALAGVHDGSLTTHAWVELRSDTEGPVWRLTPRPNRDLGPRNRCETALEKLRGDPGLGGQFSTDQEWTWDPQLWDTVFTYLELEDETLPDYVVDSFESVARRLQGIEYPSQAEWLEGEPPEPRKVDIAWQKKRDTAAETLRELAQFERRPSPELMAIEILQGRLPAIVAFEEADRVLESNYQLAEVAGSPPAALRHLCDAASLDLAAVQREIEVGGVPHVIKMVERANATLKEQFEETWSQSAVYPHLGPPTDGVLRVMIATDGGEDYSYPSDRSDGLRWFMALHAFLAGNVADAPILLVDEAETHLHYDAQADLVDILMKQRLASKVIYTTHSVGCLPPDLGRGIRAAIPAADSERSRVANSYWSVDCEGQDRVGYTPLLFAMGAQILSLTVPRYGVIVEGPSDAVLLPSLLREAADLQKLPYRVVPGLSELAEAQVAAISHHAAKVVCLTDDDEAGAKIRSKLTGALAPSEIFHLGDVAPNCTLEDLVAPEVFANAVNSELNTWGLGSFRIDAATLPLTGRWRWLEQQGEASGTEVSRLSKVRVAQRMVDFGRVGGELPGPTEPRVAPQLRRKLVKLHESVVAALSISAD